MPTRTVTLDDLDAAGVTVEDLVPVDKLALGMSTASVYRAIGRGEIPTLKIGRRRLSHARLIVAAASQNKPGRVLTPRQRERQLEAEDREAKELGF